MPKADLPLHHYWYVACTAAELTPDKPLGRQIFDELIVVYRDAEGKPVALQDRCLHRNALLSAGDVFDGCLGCPYHGWTYDNQGRCVHVPSEGPETYVREDKTLPSFPCREQDGLIWVYMGDPGDIRHDPLPMPWFQEDGWRTYYMVTPFANNVTNLAENFVDVPHTVFVHKKWFRNQKKVNGRAKVVRTRQSVEIEYDHDDSIGFAAWALNPKGEPMTHTDKFFLPNVTRVDYNFGSRNAFVISSQITPVGEYESVVYTAIASRFGWITPLIQPFFRWYTRKVIMQDVAIMKLQSKVLKHYGEAKFMSTEADLVHEWIESLRDYVEGKAPELPEPAEREISFWI